MTAGASGFGFAAITGLNFANGTLDVDYALTRVISSNQKVSFVLRSERMGLGLGLGLGFAIYCYVNGNCEIYLAAPSTTSAGRQNLRFGNTTRTLPAKPRYEGHLRITLRNGIVTYELEGLTVSAPIPLSVVPSGGVFKAIPVTAIPATIYYDNLEITSE